jgi:hypothetical protein
MQHLWSVSLEKIVLKCFVGYGSGQSEKPDPDLKADHPDVQCDVAYCGVYYSSTAM